ncbi:galactosyl transferase [Clostridia bacterium]|nr:galactosyl transferase [Clostridia bacterium]
MYEKTPNKWIKHWDFVLWDILCLALVCCILFIQKEIPEDILWNEFKQLFVFMFMDIFTFSIFDDLQDILKRSWVDEIGATLNHSVFVFLFILLYLHVIYSNHIWTEVSLFSATFFYFVLTYFERITWKSSYRAKQNRVYHSTLVITQKNTISIVIQNICDRSEYHKKIKGIVLVDDASLVGQNLSGTNYPIVASLDNVTEYVRKNWVDEVFISLPKQVEEVAIMLNNHFLMMGITVHLNLAKVINIEGQKQSIEHIGNYTVLTSSINIIHFIPLGIKRLIDIGVGIIGTVIAIILFCLLAPLIYFHSPGPVLFSQIRIGKNGRKFKIYKFRSMYLDAEERKKELMTHNRIKSGMMFKIDSDPRIIKGIGQFIRKYSLDEWPQFFNILKGDMSLVGTRPPTIDEWEKYLAHHRARLAIKPGLTGMWQISGRSAIVDFEQVVALDKQYIIHWSLWLDCKIILKTFFVVLTRKGSM